MLTTQTTDVDGAELSAVLGDLVTAAHRLTRLAAQSTESPESAAVWRTLSALNSLGPVRLGELARQSRVSQPTMTKIVRSLCEREWTKRIVDIDDGRAWQIALTPAGSAALDGWRATLASALVPYFDGVSAEDAAALKRSIEIIEERIAVGVLASVRDDQE